MTAASARPPRTIEVGATKPTYTEGYKRVVLGMLVMAYTFNFIDRTIISTIGQLIKEDLKLTDTQLGYLGGLFFALLYTLLGVPIARVAERFNRTWIISVSMAVWSGFTVLCGFAGSFLTLALFRFGVGVGEAGLSPPAHSLISDYYAPQRRASALAIYSFGIPLGTMIGAVSGGWLAQNYGWRIAFMAVGAPGLILALLVKLLVKEPPRGHSDILASEHPVLDEDLTAPPAPAFSLTREFTEIWAVIKRLFGNAGVRNMVLGVTIASFGSYGSGAFVPAYFVREFGLGYALVGLVIGLVGGFSSGIGTLVGGFLTDWASKRSAAWYGLVPAFGLLIATPIYITAYLQHDWKATAAILLIPGIFHYTYLGPSFAVVQNVIETRRRATATAVLFLFLNLIALGFGPVFTGWVIDHLGQFHFNNPNAPGIFDGLRGLFGDHGAQSFAKACPGGKAAAGAASELKAACHGTLALSTRQGIIISLCFYAWASVHYFLAARHLKRDMAKFANAV